MSEIVATPTIVPAKQTRIWLALGALFVPTMVLTLTANAVERDMTATGRPPFASSEISIKVVHVPLGREPSRVRRGRTRITVKLAAPLKPWPPVPVPTGG